MTSEQVLAERCRRKESQAFKELYDTYAGRLFSLCTRYAPTQDSAEDILQDSFIKIIQSFDSFRYRGAGSLYAWMSRVTVNRALDSIKSENRIQTVTIEDSRAEEIRLEDKDIGIVPEKVLLGLIRELPPGYRTVFNMFAIEGYSHKEISEALGITEATSRSQLQRARVILQGKIKK